MIIIILRTPLSLSLCLRKIHKICPPPSSEEGKRRFFGQLYGPVYHYIIKMFD